MSDSDTELDTSGTIDWPAIRDVPAWESLNLPSLALFILLELLQFGFIIFFYAVLSFMPELYIITVNQYFWTKVILEVILHVMSWVFIYFNVTVFYQGLMGEPAVLKEGKGFWYGGTGTVGFIIYVLLSILSVGYSIMYLIWGGIDTAKLPSSYQRTWQIILLVIVFLEAIGIILETIFLGYYLRRMVFWFGWSTNMQAASRSQFLLAHAGEDAAGKFLKNNYTRATINTLHKWGGGDLKPLHKKTRGLWKKSDVNFGGKKEKTGAYIV